MYENSELDWIGTTNTLSETTIPLLDYLINGQTQKNISIQLEKVASEKYNKENDIPHITMNTLSPESIAILKEKTSMDQRLWELASQDYHWESSNASYIHVPCKF
mmetsp:Transcript_26078/g.30287  ORF Transcript_26078/g.30287 Transcript_26078/m.30287 type:complete len:105 (+) Transcript_26078:725-1039(+)